MWLPYLPFQKQQKKESPYSLWEGIENGVPQCSILGPFVLNIFLYDIYLMLEKTYLASYADKYAPYTKKKLLTSD